MKWLRDHKNEPMQLDAKEGKVEEKEDATKPAWVRRFEEQKAAEERDWKKREHARVQDEYHSRLSTLRRAMEDKLEAEQDADLEPNAKRSKVVGVAFSRAVSDVQAAQPSSSTSKSDAKLTHGDDYFLLKDYESDTEKQLEMDDFDESPTKKRLAAARLTKEEEDLQEYPTRKIFFCSRTHSQLSQFIQEVRKTFWSNDIRLVVLGSRKTMCVNSAVNSLPTLNQINDKCLDLVGAKPPSLSNDSSNSSHPTSHSSHHAQNHSSHHKLSRLTGPELNAAFGVVPDESPSTMCSFLHTQRQAIFRDQLLAMPKDIEELVKMGQSGGECPYFATRGAIRNAELVILPYNTLLHEGTREALGIDLRGHVVIMDEAHNLIDTVNSIHSVELTYAKSSQALSQLSIYLEKYRHRLKPKNVIYIEKIQAILRSIIKYLNPTATSTAASASTTSSSAPHPSNPTREADSRNDSNEIAAEIVQMNDFLFGSGLDTHNLFKIEKYLKQSDVVHKVQGFCQTTQVEIADIKRKQTIQVQLDESEFERHRPSLGIVASFLATLTSQSKDACLLVSRHASNPKLSSLKYILLNPEIQFQSILRDAKAVILAGGTLQPFGDFYQHLISSCPTTSSTTSTPGSSSSPSLATHISIGASKSLPATSMLDRVETFTCSHIIPDSNLTTLIMPQGPTGVDFTFTHERRHLNSEAFDELAIVFTNICNTVPDGVVVFSPSYHFEDALISRWKATGAFDKIDARKKIFREPRTTSGVDGILSDYEATISNNLGGASTPTGAILSCVVGGKLSEGINFKDHLGRCVVVLGLPFPNARDPVLMQRLAHITYKLKQAGPQSAESSAASSSDYYENLCMKAVNQSIGRSIRHIGDYATILLIDSRYNKPSIQGKLPEWIRRRLTPTSSFGETYRNMVQFFLGKDAKQRAIYDNRRSARGE